MTKTNLGSLIIFLLLVLSLKIKAQENAAYKINLAGSWSFAIDSLDKGIEEKWYSRHLSDKINLPGSMSTNGKGDDVSMTTPWTGDAHKNSPWWTDSSYAKYRQPGNIKISFWLQPNKVYVGPAWYQKVVVIPNKWQGKDIELFLERCHWETTLWIDHQKVGMQNALGAPHMYSLGEFLKPGKHIITLRVDNRIKDIDPGENASSLTDNTQTNWNGIVGNMALTAKPLIYIADLQLYPDIDKKIVVARIMIANTSGKASAVKLKLQAQQTKVEKGNHLSTFIQSIVAEKDSTWVNLTYPMGSAPALWDEFTPNLYQMKVNLQSESGTDQLFSIFGMRKFKTDNRHFTINDRQIFLRGTLECAIFPKTGYPATDIASWSRIFRICKSYGLNHMRFHSWCPPEAAFDAADEAGVYLSVESSAWTTVGEGKPIDTYIYDESKRIIKQFGNHPSFCMMLYGNEPGGGHAAEYLAKFVSYWKKEDPRRLYSSASGWPVIAESDYNCTYGPRISFWGKDANSVLNNGIARTDYDWSAVINKWPQPTISHELGQWCVYPNFKETKKYIGVLKPKNFDIFYDRLKEHHLEHLADSFFNASGKLQVLCYKAEIEAQLRTKNIGGFQLLDLHDFPGQGTALVGILDPFWDSKGYISPEEYRHFCDSTVPLFRTPHLVYQNNEFLEGEIEVSHFGRKPINKVTPVWELCDINGAILFKGALPTCQVPIGNGIILGKLKQSLTKVTTPQELVLKIKIDGHQNSWHIFVYPEKKPTPDPSIYITQKLDEKGVHILNNGGSVLLTIQQGSIKPKMGGSVQVGFSPIFWNLYWSGNQPPHTLGILCNPKHPALSKFPTEYHSNWQWQDGLLHSNVIFLDSLSQKIDPIVRVVDDWYTARSLGLIFECKVGNGKLLISGVDLLTEKDKRPEAKQLLYSLTNYMMSAKFRPRVPVTIDKVKNLFD